jgi:hypothetical protein
VKKHLSLWLAAILGASHLFFLGLSIVDQNWRGGEDYAVVYLDLPLFALCQRTSVCGYRNFGPLFSNLFLLTAGTLMYALIGFVIGTVIAWIRGFIARRRGENQ